MNWTHLHLALNHIPVLGTLFLALLLFAGWFKESRDIQRMAFCWMVSLMVISIPIKFTGDFAHEQNAESPWLIESYVTPHEQAADQATTGIFLSGILAAVALFKSRAGKEVPPWTTWATLFLAIITFGLMVRAANLGGQIRHTEIRPTISLEGQ